MWKHKNFINLQLCAGETWVWNEYPQFPDDNYVICENVPFTSNQTKFTSIIMKNGESGYEDGLYYNSEYVFYGEVREWVNSAFRTITFDNPVTENTYVNPNDGSTLLQWLQEYAVKQSTPQPTLAFKHFFDAGTIGTGTVKFRHYSQRAQLATPQNVAASGTTVSWGAVENATSYEILVSGSSFGTVSTTSVDLSTLSGWASLTDGTYNITIVAKAAGYRDSEPSSAVSVVKGVEEYSEGSGSGGSIE